MGRWMGSVSGVTSRGHRPRSPQGGVTLTASSPRPKPRGRVAGNDSALGPSRAPAGGGGIHPPPCHLKSDLSAQNILSKIVHKTRKTVAPKALEKTFSRRLGSGGGEGVGGLDPGGVGGKPPPQRVSAVLRPCHACCICLEGAPPRRHPCTPEAPRGRPSHQASL